MRAPTRPAPTWREQDTAEKVLRHGAVNARTGAFLNNADLRALVALLDRLRAGAS